LGSTHPKARSAASQEGCSKQLRDARVLGSVKGRTLGLAQHS
jgi:hypothetical protein